MSENEFMALDDSERRILRSLEKYPDDKKRNSTEAIKSIKMIIDMDFPKDLANIRANDTIGKDSIYVLSLCLRKTSLI